MVRDTAASDGFTGFGVAVQRDGMTLTEPSVVTIRQSVLERNLGVTLFVEGSEAHVEATVVRDTLPNVELWAGYGFYVHDDQVATPGPNRGTLVVRSSVADRCRSVAVFVAGSDATIESTLVRDTALEGDTGKFGRAIAAQISPATLERASVEVKFCAIERASDAGVVAIGSDALVEATRITDTMATALGTYGDGVSVSTAQFTDAPGSMTIAGLLIEKSARAGISTFGASAKVSDTAFDCNGIDINAEAIAGIEPDLVNAGGNTCGCEEAERVCVVASSMLLPPEPVDSVH